MEDTSVTWGTGVGGGDPGSGRLGGESYNNKTKKENTSVTWGGGPWGREARGVI